MASGGKKFTWNDHITSESRRANTHVPATLRDSAGPRGAVPEGIWTALCSRGWVGRGVQAAHPEKSLKALQA